MKTSSIYEISVETIDGETADLSPYRGKVLLIVNTASKCGYTPQYEALEKIYQRFRGKGLVVLGFPSNDFGAQEPAANDEIKQFCQLNFGVSFPLFAKGPVKGADRQPLFSALIKESSDSQEIKWNFEKFLVNRDGHVVGRFPSSVKPDDVQLVDAIEKVL